MITGKDVKAWISSKLNYFHSSGHGGDSESRDQYDRDVLNR